MPTFLVVEVPGMTTPGAAFSRLRPDVQMDFFLEAPKAGAVGGALRVICQATGPAADTLALRGDLAAKYPGLRLIDGPRPDGSWMGAFQVPVAPIDPVAQAVARFAGEHGIRLAWGRLQGGVVFLRILLDEPTQAQPLADMLRGYLAALRLDADVSVETEAQERMADWLRMMRESLERKPARGA